MTALTTRNASTPWPQILADNTRIDVHVDVVIPRHTLAQLRNTGASITGFGPVDSTTPRPRVTQGRPLATAITDPTTGQLIDGHKAYPS